MNKVTLPVRAKHFENTDYSNNCHCAIAKAAKEFFGAVFVSEGVDNIDVLNDIYRHEAYNFDNFIEDLGKARCYNFDETIIFELELTPYEPNI